MGVIVGISSAFLLLAGLASASAGGLPGKYQVEGKNPEIDLHAARLPLSGAGNLA